MASASIHHVQLHQIGAATYGRVWLTLPGFDEPLVLDAFRIKRRQIDGGLSVLSPGTQIRDITISCVRLPSDLFAAVVAAFAAELGEPIK
jgi:hypothetical protein